MFQVVELKYALAMGQVQAVVIDQVVDQVFFQPQAEQTGQPDYADLAEILPDEFLEVITMSAVRFDLQRINRRVFINLPRCPVDVNCGDQQESGRRDFLQVPHQHPKVIQILFGFLIGQPFDRWRGGANNQIIAAASDLGNVRGIVAIIESRLTVQTASDESAEAN